MIIFITFFVSTIPGEDHFYPINCLSGDKQWKNSSLYCFVEKLETTMGQKFRLLETTKSSLWDYGWFDISRFKVEISNMESQSHQFLIGELLKDPIFRRSLCCFVDPWGESVDNHGPFIWKKLSVDLLQSLSNPDLENKILAAFSDNEYYNCPPSEEQIVPIEKWVKEVTVRGDSIFELRALKGMEVLVDYNFIWDFFFEFICFNSMQGEITVAIIGSD